MRISTVRKFWEFLVADAREGGSRRFRVFRLLRVYENWVASFSTIYIIPISIILFGIIPL
jgi:hypothetical protein